MTVTESAVHLVAALRDVGALTQGQVVHYHLLAPEYLYICDGPITTSEYSACGCSGKFAIVYADEVEVRLSPEGRAFQGGSRHRISLI